MLGESRDMLSNVTPWLCITAHFFLFFLFRAWQMVMFRLKVISLLSQRPCCQWFLTGASLAWTGWLCSWCVWNGWTALERHLRETQCTEEETGIVTSWGWEIQLPCLQRCEWDLRDVIKASFQRSLIFPFLIMDRDPPIPRGRPGQAKNRLFFYTVFCRYFTVLTMYIMWNRYNRQRIARGQGQTTEVSNFSLRFGPASDLWPSWGRTVTKSRELWCA